MAQTPPISVADAQAQLRTWLDALERCSTGESYTVGGRTLTRQDVEAVIMPQITRWHRTVAALEAAEDGHVRPLGATAAFPAPGSGAGGLLSDAAWRSSS